MPLLHPVVVRRRLAWRMAAALGAALLAAAAPAAFAAFQTFAIDEAYSTADGEIQFVVLREAQGANDQTSLSGHALTATHAGAAKVFTFDRDLAGAAANRRVLLATPAYAALNLVTPDYVIPSRFVPTDGGTLDYAGVDQWTLAPVPTDGTNAAYRNGTVAPNVAINFAGRSATAPALPITVVEYFNAALDHYFVSGLAPDLDALDSGRIGGWARTGLAFAALPAAFAGSTSGAASPLSPVCRFYIPPQHGDSHFFSASPAECASVLAKIGTDPNYSSYAYESPNVFAIALPDTATGACPANTVPVYRLWNQRADSNHRYTIDVATKQAMLARGYVTEGYGPDAVAMCATLAPTTSTDVTATGPSPFTATCDGVVPTGFAYTNAEVEPWLAVDPRDPNHLIGVWQQDRWSNGGARGLLTGVSFDAGRTWTRRMAPFSRCTGGTAGNGGNFTRASDPWVTIGPDGTAHQSSLSFTGGALAQGSSNAMMASRSVDGGLSWSNPVALMRDGSTFFNDKGSITADPTDARYVYATWDRLSADNTGPSYLARSANSGVSWDSAVPIYDPGSNSQTINNQIVVLPTGTLVAFFTQLDGIETVTASLRANRSTDKGVTWSGPVVIAAALTIGTRDPQTGNPIRDGSGLGAIAAGPRGELAVAWQDARFSGGAREGIAFTQSKDGGLTWSPPAGIHGDPAVQALLPAVAFLADGTVGVTYYDMRSNTPDAATLPVDLWLASSSDGVAWSERHVAGPFDLAMAPDAGGLFLGDYQGLAANGTLFLPFFTSTNGGDFVNRTDVHFAQVGPGGVAKSLGADDAAPSAAGRAYHAIIAAPIAPAPELQRRVSANLERIMARRLPTAGDGSRMLQSIATEP